MKSKSHRFPRKMKKLLGIGCSDRIKSKYQGMLNDSGSRLQRTANFWYAYDLLQRFPDKTIEELYDMFGVVTGEMVEAWNNQKLRDKLLLNIKRLD